MSNSVLFSQDSTTKQLLDWSVQKHEKGEHIKGHAGVVLSAATATLEALGDLLFFVSDYCTAALPIVCLLHFPHCPVVWFGSHQVGVLPSKGRDITAMKIVEKFAASPILLSKILVDPKKFKEQPIDGINGVLYRCQNQKSFASKVGAALLSKPAIFAYGALAAAGAVVAIKDPKQVEALYESSKKFIASIIPDKLTSTYNNFFNPQNAPPADGNQSDNR